jgi:hypothetical protein
MGMNDRNEISAATVWVGALITLVIAMGIMFVVFGPGDIVAGSKAYGWHPQKCMVVSSSLAEKGTGQGELTVGVRYEFEGKSRETTCLLADTVENLKRQMEVFMKPGEEVKCRVNPAHPTEAMLDAAYIPFEFFLFLGVSLVVICVVTAAVWHVWLMKRNQSSWVKAVDWMERFGTERACAMVLFFCGVATLKGFVSLAVMLGTLSWTEVKATIEECSVTKERQGEMWDYKVVLVYRYELDGKEYKGSRWSVSDEGYSASKKKRNAVEAMKAGDVVTCYVNPKRLDEAILDRNARAYVGLGAMPFLLMLAGWGLWRSLNEKERKPRTLEAMLPEELDALAAMAAIPVHLQYELTRRQRVMVHMRIWTPQWIVIGACVAITPAGMATYWWYIAVPVVVIWFWREFFIGLRDALSQSGGQMDIVIEKTELGIEVPDGRIWAEHVGIIDIRKHVRDVWTVHYAGGEVINIPAAMVTNAQVEYMRKAAMRIEEDADSEALMGGE